MIIDHQMKRPKIRAPHPEKKTLPETNKVSVNSIFFEIKKYVNAVGLTLFKVNLALVWMFFKSVGWRLLLSISLGCISFFKFSDCCKLEKTVWLIKTCYDFSGFGVRTKAIFLLLLSSRCLSDLSCSAIDVSFALRIVDSKSCVEYFCLIKKKSRSDSLFFSVIH